MNAMNIISAMIMIVSIAVMDQIIVLAAQVAEVMEVQRSQGSFREDIELDTGRILSLAAHTAAKTETSPADQHKQQELQEKAWDLHCHYHYHCHCC